MSAKAKIGVLGASGYTGAELVRLLLRHPHVEIGLLTADRRAGKPMADVFPQFAPFGLPTLQALDQVDWPALGLDLAFCALPHGTTQTVISDSFKRMPAMKVVDLSADFRIADPAAYERWYGHPHAAVELQKKAVYGLTEVYREKIKSAQLVANPGCYTSCAELALIPLLRGKAIDPDEIVIDAKSGMTGAGRAAKEEMLFSEDVGGFPRLWRRAPPAHGRARPGIFARCRARCGRKLHTASRADEPRHSLDHLCARAQGYAAGSACAAGQGFCGRAVRARARRSGNTRRPGMCGVPT